MRSRIYGSRSGDHLVLIGTWDPTLQAHEHVFRDAVTTAASHGRQVAVITLNPAPPAQIFGPATFPTFTDVSARLALQRQCGVQTRIVVQMSRRELEYGADFFLSQVSRLIPFSELWLGAKQSLGPNRLGDHQAVLDYCEKRRVSLQRLPELNSKKTMFEARKFLAAGHLRRAIDLIQYPLYWARPRTTVVKLYWPPGCYRVASVDKPFEGSYVDISRITLSAESTIDASWFNWPDRRIPWLAFLSGPADPEGTPDDFPCATDSR